MVPIFGHWISAATLESTTGFGVGGITSAYAAFQDVDVNLFFLGRKNLEQSEADKRKLSSIISESGG